MNRVGILGGSDAAAACGLDPYCSRLALWARVRGELPPQPESEAMAWGTRLQQTVLEEAVRELGGAVREPACESRDDARPWRVGHMDALARLATGPLVIIEAKVTGQRIADDDPLPDSWTLQCLHYLDLVPEAHSAWVAALVCGTHLMLREVPRDEAAIAALREAEIAFWSLVESGTPPEADASPSTRQALLALYPDASVPTWELDQSARRHLAEYRRCKQHLDEWEQRAEAERAALCAALGAAGAEVGTMDGERACSWRRVESGRIDADALRRDYPDVAAAVTRRSATRRFLLHTGGEVR